MKPASPLAIDLKSIRKSFGPKGAKLYDDLSMQVSKGEAVAIVGPSGCGKSTLLNIIAKLEPVDAGQVRHRGSDKPVDAKDLRMGYLFQRDALLPWATVFENILLGARCRNELDVEAVEHAESFLARLNISQLRDRFPKQLSGGQRQLVALVQNLLVRPELLLLDEPFAHLDFQAKLVLEAELMRLVRQTRTTDGGAMTLVLVTHDIEEAIVMADRILVLGGYPDGPTRIGREIHVKLSEEERDPVRARKSQTVAGYFEDVWESVRALSPLKGVA